MDLCTVAEVEACHWIQWAAVWFFGFQQVMGGQGLILAAAICVNIRGCKPSIEARDWREGYKGRQTWVNRGAKSAAHLFDQGIAERNSRQAGLAV